MIPKFRAYVKNENKIYPVTRIDWVYEDVQMDERPYEEVRKSLFTLPIDDVVTMQSTGLFDNSMPKKLIFENDIVEWEHKDTGQLIRGIVKYDTELGFWGMTDVRFNDLTAIGYLANKRVTVLGNIYQNKELVEE
ncbi:TPA: YopX family protein [Streptococcus suis]